MSLAEEHETALLRREMRRRLADLRDQGRPSRQDLIETAASVTRWRREQDIGGLWEAAPLMATATLDDAFGHGLELIHRFAEAAGLRLMALGTMQTTATVAAACRRHRPALLGLTVLQFDTEEALTTIRADIPETTRIVAGGPVFAADPDLAARAGIDFVARDAAAFWEYLLDIR